MSYKLKSKSKTPVQVVVFKIILGFLIPYVLVNGIIFFLYIQTPKIVLVKQDSKDYEDNKIKFTIDCILPITDVKTYYQESEVSYSKLGNTYIVNAEYNGIYDIKVTALNSSSSKLPVDIMTQDAEAPTIDLNNAIITGDTLLISVHDNQSEINYDNLYATIDKTKRIEPTSVDKSVGTVQFQITDGKSIVVHVEDSFGNFSETSFTIN